MNAKDYRILASLVRAGISECHVWHARTLRRASLTLHRWHELECGDSNTYASWALERDEATGAPYMVTYYHAPKATHLLNVPTRRRYPDKEKGAIKRIQAVCKELSLHYYIQSDPRGCALYISREQLTCQNYTNGVPIC